MASALRLRRGESHTGQASFIERERLANFGAAPCRADASNDRGRINPTLTVLQNTTEERLFRNRINCAAILADYGEAWSNGGRHSEQANQGFDSHVDIMELPMKSLLARFVKDESGATAIEYALIASGIGIAIIAAVNSLGTAISNKFGSISTSLK